MDKKELTAESCTYKEGALPSCAPLAVGFVPRQDADKPRYESDKALARGTLFPGLDLPLRNIVNTGVADVPTAELMALDFAAFDLALYLDTHPNDEEAFELYQELLTLARQGRERYEKLYGPLTHCALRNAKSYVWTHGNWPWNPAED